MPERGGHQRGLRLAASPDAARLRAGADGRGRHRGRLVRAGCMCVPGRTRLVRSGDLASPAAGPRLLRCGGGRRPRSGAPRRVHRRHRAPGVRGRPTHSTPGRPTSPSSPSPTTPMLRSPGTSCCAGWPPSWRSRCVSPSGRPNSSPTRNGAAVHPCWRQCIPLPGRRHRTGPAGPSLGRIRNVDLSWIRARGVPQARGWFTNRSQAGGGVLFDLGWHLLDVLDAVVGRLTFDQVAAVTTDDHVNEKGWTRPGAADPRPPGSRRTWKTRCAPSWSPRPASPSDCKPAGPRTARRATSPRSRSRAPPGPRPQLHLRVSPHRVPRSGITLVRAGEVSEDHGARGTGRGRVRYASSPC